MDKYNRPYNTNIKGSVQILIRYQLLYFAYRLGTVGKAYLDRVLHNPK